LNQKSKKLRSGDQGELGKAVAVLSRMPWSLIRWVLNITSFINYDLRINLEWAGMPRDPFGSVMITNIGALGGDMAWAPLVPYTRVPLLLTLGAVQDRAWIYEGKIEIRPILRVGITFDHRLMDGTHAAAMGQIFKKCFADPWKHL
jgi:pyruvate dehydrogenase E2 component (dihydrolipoamide acetyltransferase)